MGGHFQIGMNSDLISVIGSGDLAIGHMIYPVPNFLVCHINYYIDRRQPGFIRSWQKISGRIDPFFSCNKYTQHQDTARTRKFLSHALFNYYSIRPKKFGIPLNLLNNCICFLPSLKRVFSSCQPSQFQFDYLLSTTKGSDNARIPNTAPAYQLLNHRISAEIFKVMTLIRTLPNYVNFTGLIHVCR